MKKFAVIITVFVSLTAQSQIGYEQFYSEKQLTAILQQAKTDMEQLDAYGMLAMHYKNAYRDSLANTYLEKVKAISADPKNVKLKARGLWWDNYYDPDTIKAKRYIDWATNNDLIEDKIAGYVELTRVNIHINLLKAEENILNAKKLWDNWKVDSISKDSLKLEIFQQLAHVFIHKRDGVKAVNYLLPLQDYANQDRNLALKVLALDFIANMYFEWPGQYKKATEWTSKLYDTHKKSGNPNKILYSIVGLALQYCNRSDTVNARIYCREAERLWDSVGAYGSAIQYYYASKYYGGLISSGEYVQLVEANFGGRLLLSPLKKISLKLALYSQVKNLDSINHYLARYKKLAGDSLANKDPEYKYYLVEYYMATKQFVRAIPILKESKEKEEKKLNMPDVLFLEKSLADAYAGIHDYKQAHQFLDKAYKLKDSLEALSGKVEVSLIEMQKQEELQTAAYNEEKKLQAAEQSRIRYKNRVSLYGLLAGIAILLLVAGLLWRNNRQKQKAKTKIESAYAKLKSTQSQLIQSEKMASLGELTAGIAHEIQNPLNFVNNFSEVNDELLKELKTEAEKGNLEEVKAIANDIAFNSEKINHHGKRADSIVKGMLQHSRTNSGQKEPTDINALADEYLRLAYHGLRAKDKSFNAVTKTDFDSKVRKINIIPQDIGRVMLNLINNAFYAVAEKNKLSGNGYEPTVSVTTKKEKDKIEIKVKDNGNGIQQKVLDKIFQPFFTTKPAGQGTGLGLSLAYDIVTKVHGGSIKVETAEGHGTEFIIELPDN
jgi:signal transduction histidine kinase